MDVLVCIITLALFFSVPIILLAALVTAPFLYGIRKVVTWDRYDFLQLVIHPFVYAFLFFSMGHFLLGKTSQNYGPEMRFVAFTIAASPLVRLFLETKQIFSSEKRSRYVFWFNLILVVATALLWPRIEGLGDF